MSEPHNQTKPIKKRLVRSFGRIKSRKFSSHKKFLLDELLPKYEINIPTISDQNLLFHNKPESLKIPTIFTKNYFSSPNSLEIGFGFGDFLFFQAQNQPNCTFFGCEPHLNGVVNLLAKLEQNPLPNLKVSKIDIRLLLPAFESEFFNKIFILFPDPWPKTRHVKRRLVNTEFLDEFIAPKLEIGGSLIIATDHDQYKTWILNQVLASKKFYWNANNPDSWQNFPDFWIETKYQKKAKTEGRVSIFIELIKAKN